MKNKEETMLGMKTIGELFLWVLAFVFICLASAVAVFAIIEHTFGIFTAILTTIIFAVIVSLIAFWTGLSGILLLKEEDEEA